MNETHETELVSSIHDLTRRLNDATWAARRLFGITLLFDRSEFTGSGEMLHPKILRVISLVKGHRLQDASSTPGEIRS